MFGDAFDFCRTSQSPAAAVRPPPGKLGTVVHLVRRFGVVMRGGHAAPGHLHNRILREFDNS
jgi:hypothetical protein